MWLKSVLVLMVVSGCLSVPQGRFRARQQQQEVVNQQPSHNLDPTATEGLNHEHAKLIENLQRLKRTLDDVKERVAVGKGTYGGSAAVDMKNPEGAILTVLKSLQEQGQLFAMINDMLKAGSEVQNQTDKIQAISTVQEQARAESSMADHTNQIGGASPSAIPHGAVSSSAFPPTGPTAAAPTTSGQYSSSSTQRTTSRKNKDAYDPSKQHGYDDYQYQYRDDTGDATGDDQYDYHYDAQGYDSPRGPVTTTTTTTTRRPPPQRRLRGRITRSEYY